MSKNPSRASVSLSPNIVQTPSPLREKTKFDNSMPFANISTLPRTVLSTGIPTWLGADSSASIRNAVSLYQSFYIDSISHHSKWYYIGEPSDSHLIHNVPNQTTQLEQILLANSHVSHSLNGFQATLQFVFTVR